MRLNELEHDGLVEGRTSRTTHHSVRVHFCPGRCPCVRHISVFSRGFQGLYERERLRIQAQREARAATARSLKIGRSH